MARCLRSISFPIGGGIVSRSHRGISFPMGGHQVPMFSRYPFSDGGGASCPDDPAVSLFRWRWNIVSQCLRGIPFPMGGGIVSRCLRGILFKMEGASFLGVFGVSLFRNGGGHHVPMSSRYPFLRLGGASCSDDPAVSLFRWGRDIVSRCLRGISFQMGGIVSRRLRGIPFSVRGGGILSRCLRGIPFSDGGGGGHRFSMSSRYPFSDGGGHCVPISSRYPFFDREGHRVSMTL